MISVLIAIEVFIEKSLNNNKFDNKEIKNAIPGIDIDQFDNIY